MLRRQSCNHLQVDNFKPKERTNVLTWDQAWHKQKQGSCHSSISCRDKSRSDWYSGPCHARPYRHSRRLDFILAAVGSHRGFEQHSDLVWSLVHLVLWDEGTHMFSQIDFSHIVNAWVMHRVFQNLKNEITKTQSLQFLGAFQKWTLLHHYVTDSLSSRGKQG